MPLKVGNTVTVKQLDAEAGQEADIDAKLSEGVRPGDDVRIRAVCYNNKIKTYKVAMITGNAKGKVLHFRPSELERISYETISKTMEEKYKSKFRIAKAKVRNTISLMKYLVKRLQVVERSLSTMHKKKDDTYTTVHY